MNNLVLGASGFIGKYLCQYLKNLGENVVEYDIVRGPKEDCRYAKLPLTNIDRVYFLAWKVGGANYLYDPSTQKEQLDWNIKLLANTMEQLTDIPFVFVSSQLAENCDTVYGVLKKLGEVWTKLNGGRVIRFWNVYGPYEKQSVKSHVVADFIHQALTKNCINMLTDGSELRQFIHADDICKILHLSFGYNGVYDASSQKWNSIREIADIISKYTGCNVIPQTIKGNSLIIHNKQIICPTEVSLNDGLKRTIELFKKCKNNEKNNFANSFY